MVECLVEKDERGIALNVWPVLSRRAGHFIDVRMTKSDWIDVLEREGNEISRG